MLSREKLIGLACVSGASVYLVLKLRKRKSDVPGPRWFLPFVGEMPAFISNPVEFVWRRYKWYNSPIFTSHLFGTRVYVCGDTEAARSVLSNSEEVESFIPMKSFYQIVDMSNTRGVRHKYFRKHMGFCLSPGNVKANLDQFTRLIQQHVCDWAGTTPGQAEQPHTTVFLDKVVRRLVLETGVGPIMGLQVEPDQADHLLHLISTVQAGLFAAPIYFPGTTWYKAINTRPQYLAALKNLLTQRFPVDPQTHVLQPEKDRGGAPGVDTTWAILQEFADLNDPPTVDKLAERLLQNMLGATETSFGLLWALLVVVAARPDVQKRIREEQTALIKSSGRNITWEAVQQGMPYTDACVREAARLVPSAHGVFRRPLKDIQVCGYTVPKGAMVIVSMDLMTARETAALETAPRQSGDAHKQQSEQGGPGSEHSHQNGTTSQRCFSQDELLGLGSYAMPLCMDYNQIKRAYRPERWLSDQQRPRYLHVFSHGAHYCLGKDLALLELKLVLACLARRCTWELDPPEEPVLSFIPFVRLSSGKPAHVRLRPDPL